MDYSNYAPHASQPYSTLYGLPTPDQPPQAPSEDVLHDPFALNGAYNQYYPGFDPSFRLDPSSTFGPPPHSPPDSFTKHSVSSNDVHNSTKPEPTSIDGDDSQYRDPAGRSSSEEKDSAMPAQSKRKAQNRAAQRAFRERKERHVRDLEDKVNNLEQSSSTLQADNERLKRELAKYATENEILRATSHSLHGNSGAKEAPAPTVTGPMTYSPTDFYSTLMPEAAGPTGPTPTGQHRVTVCAITGERLLDASATWDLIQSHELFKRGQVNIGDVAERLKGSAQCNGQGPAFKESQILKAIEESVADRDELI
ncbi:uncharacterized protein N7473_007413 [Penicillium subrubescens]|uniref:Fluconazole resistance protein 3 n=1 Tax=Penicillium subrubescens TaxID=1316194 RepID=A0A1Q5UQH1_9EURO|nr:uncharacterized protein N7473_007413 [Penicillium subrubescens]KAJ5891185.1 hypothetical protein N7473_007413 [Penicillium subrubescens]OKP14709.1 Fluconazole resistance protein 3 [Penicillium subrubescens]